MFELVDLLNVLPHVSRLSALPLIELKLGLAFLKGFGELILDILHFGNVDLLVDQSLLQHPVLFPFAIQLEHRQYLVLILLRVGNTALVSRGIEGGVSESFSSLSIGLDSVVVDRLLLRHVRKVHAGLVVIFSIEAVLGVGGLSA
jgi:hypothetical protein